MERYTVISQNIVFWIYRYVRNKSTHGNVAYPSPKVNIKVKILIVSYFKEKETNINFELKYKHLNRTKK